MFFFCDLVLGKVSIYRWIHVKVQTHYWEKKYSCLSQHKIKTTFMVVFFGFWNQSDN